MKTEHYVRRVQMCLYQDPEDLEDGCRDICVKFAALTGLYAYGKTIQQAIEIGEKAITGVIEDYLNGPPCVIPWNYGGMSLLKKCHDATHAHAYVTIRCEVPGESS